MKQTNKSTIFIIVFLVLFLAAGTYYFFVLPSEEATTPQDAPITITRDEIGLEFSYLAGPTSLSLFEPSSVAAPMRAAFILIPSEQYVMIRNEAVAPEQAPASISIFVFDKELDEGADNATDLSRRERLEQWAITFDEFTGITRALSAPETIQIDGVSGLRYQNESLYNQDIYLISYKNLVYMYVGQSADGSDDMSIRFAEVLDSISFN